MAKRGSKSTKLAQKATGANIINAQPSATASTSAGPSKITKHSKITDELRQAVKDLGGDDEDLDLIDGIDEEDEDPSSGAASKGKGEKKGSSDEKSLKKELGAFMKGLDFAAVGGADVESEEEEEETSGAESEGEDGDPEDGEQDQSQDEEDNEEEEDEEDDEEEEEEDEQTQPQPESKAALKNTAEPAQAAPVDKNSSSGTDVPAAPVWTSLLPELPPLTTAPPQLTPQKLNTLRQKATTLFENLPPLNRASSSSDAAFINQILQSGTHQDKLSALVLLVRESPVHAVRELNKLRYMAGWKEDGIGAGTGGNKDQRVAVMKALADWWVSGGGKSQGKLRYFADQPLLAHPQLTERHLLVFAFEDYLKKWFFHLLQVLEVLSHDTLPFVRTQALHIIFRLLSGNAEQEQNLLRLGVNKLGDTDRPVASKASHHILQLLQAHPAMKAVVAREVSALIFKPTGQAAASASSSSHVRFDDDSSKDKGKKADKSGSTKPDTVNHARYYGLITLNQITLTRKDQEVAGKMVDLYFEVFREILGDSMKEKSLGQGEDDDEDEIAQEQVEKVAGKVEKWRGRRKGAKPKGDRKSALAQEEDLIETGEAKLVAAVLTGINRALPFAKLDETMFTSYMDTLFKITHAGTFNTSIQALNLIYQVSRTDSESRQVVSDRFYRTLYDSLFDGRLITSSKQAMYLNLLFKAMKADERITRVMAFVKRLLQMLSMHQPPFICGALYLLGDLFSVTPGLKKMLIEPEDDGEEHFVDADQKERTVDAITDKKKKSEPIGKEYVGKKREPLYANADSSCLWDLIPFLNHFHPSVSLQANQLLLSQPLTGSADISLNTLVSFLDRFVYRNPKKTLQPKGASIMQPAAALDKSGMIVNNRGAKAGGDGQAGLTVNSEAFWRKKIEDVPVEMMFFHKYFAEKLKRNENRKKGKKGGQGSDEEDEDEVEVPSDDESAGPDIDDEDDEDAEEEEDSDAEEAEVWKAMKASMPAVDDDMGLSEDGDSDEMSDYDDDDDDDVSIEEGPSDVDEEELEVDEDEDEEEESEGEVPSKKGKGKASANKRAASPAASSDSDFPDLADEDDDLLSDSEMDFPDIRLGEGEDEEEDEEEAEEEEEDAGKQGKRKRGDDRKERRKKRREMPTFGSYEDYQALIEAGGDEED
ncbi:ribosome biogenesis protein MAK21 [Kwoniella heveanensis CBS 569]|nr:ribosome biogenesis protein MAK21 [Kwoniella heveanensis CBS 569]